MVNPRALHQSQKGQDAPYVVCFDSHSDDKSQSFLEPSPGYFSQCSIYCDYDISLGLHCCAEVPLKQRGQPYKTKVPISWNECLLQSTGTPWQSFLIKPSRLSQHDDDDDGDDFRC